MGTVKSGLILAMLACGTAVALAAAPAATTSITAPTPAERQSAVTQLQEGTDPAARQQAIALLATAPTLALPQLRAAMFIDYSQALDELGAADFKTRRQATARLKRAGQAARSPIEKRLRETTDPEVREHCREILTGLTGESVTTGNRAILDAVRVAFTGAAPGTPEADFWFDQFKTLVMALPQEQRAALLTSHEPQPEAPALGDLLWGYAQRATTQAAFEPPARLSTELQPQERSEPALARLEELAPGRSDLRRDLMRKMATSSWLCNRLSALNGTPEDAFPVWLKTMAADPELIQHYGNNWVNSLLAHGILAQAVGMALRLERLPPAVAEIVATVRPPNDVFAAAPTDAERARVLKQRLTAVSSELMGCQDPEIAAIGAQLSAAKPMATSDELIAYLVNRSDFRGQSTALYRLRQEFPQDLPKLRQLVAAAICNSSGKAAGQQEVQRLQSLWRDLGPADGAPLDDWWAREAALPEMTTETNRLNAWLATGVELKVTPARMLPFLGKGGDEANGLVAHLLTGGPEAEAAAIRICLEPPPANAVWPPCIGAAGAVLHKRPELFPELFKLTLGVLAQTQSNHLLNTQHFAGDANGLGAYGVCLRRHPEHAALVRACLDRPEAVVRLVACGMLVQGMQKEPRLGPVLTKLLEQPEFADKTGLIIQLLFMGGDSGNTAAWDAFGRLLANPKTQESEIRQLMNCLDETSAASVPFLGQHLAKLELPAKAEFAIPMAAAILLNAPQDQAARDVLLAILNGKDANLAAQAMKELGEAGVAVPVQSPERLQFMISGARYLGTIFEALETAPANVPAAAPAIRACLDSRGENLYGLEDLLWKNDALQRLLAPDILERCGSADLTIRRRAANLLPNCPKGLKSRGAQVQERLRQETLAHVRDTLIWAIANVGPEAAACAPDIEKRLAEAAGAPRIHCLFALARISPDPAARRRYAEQLVTATEKAAADYHRLALRALGLIRAEFPELVDPVLQRALAQPEIRGQRWEKNLREEAMQRLTGKPPFAPATVTALRAGIEDAVADGYVHSCSLHMAVDAAVIDPVACRPLLPLLETLRPNCPVPGDALAKARRALRQPMPAADVK